MTQQLRAIRGDHDETPFVGEGERDGQGSAGSIVVCPAAVRACDAESSGELVEDRDFSVEVQVDERNVVAEDRLALWPDAPGQRRVVLDVEPAALEDGEVRPSG